MKAHDSILSALAAFPALLFPGVLSVCGTEAEGITGDTGCYSVQSGGISVSGGTVTVDGMNAEVKKEGCPGMKKVQVTIFNDGNGNGKQEANENSVESEFACSATPASSMSTGSFSFNKNGATGGNAYNVSITDANGGMSSFGGNF